MKYNSQEVAELQPDYLGFIFWEPSKRFFEGDIPQFAEGIKRIGVFVDAEIDEVLQKTEKYRLDGVQLHGTESPNYCNTLRHSELVSESQKEKQVPIDIIKVFSIKDDFDFDVLESYEDVCDYFLFDTKGKLPGGNGYAFDWKVLKNYPSTKPYFLSGGIGLQEIDTLKEFIKKPESKYCHAIDVNSRFEIKPGLKNIEMLTQLKEQLICNL